jgi:hypothetical protein
MKSSVIFTKGSGSILFAARIPAHRSQTVRRKGNEIGRGETTGDVFDVRIEAAIFVNDEDDRMLAIFYRTREIAFDRAVPGGRLHCFVANLDAFVIRRDLLRPGIVRRQALKDCHRGQSAGRELAKTIKEGTAVDVAVLVLVKQVQQLLRVIRCLLSFHSFSLRGIGAEYEVTLLLRR